VQVLSRVPGTGIDGSTWNTYWREYLVQIQGQAGVPRAGKGEVSGADIDGNTRRMYSYSREYLVQIQARVPCASNY
jgi:hypothetical protein